jgi:RimJ/RimL family protein N-acetyltransferase
MGFELRRAREEDVLLVFEWANDPAARQLSFSSKPILMETHREWFTKKLYDPYCTYLILCEGDEPAGQIRFERAGEDYLISFSISSEMRGKGLGTRILEMGEAYMIKRIEAETILAGFVKKRNIASIRSFTRNGYESAEADPQDYPDSLIFKKRIRPANT